MNASRVEQFGKHVLAALVLVIAAWIVLKVVIGIVAVLFVPIVVILAILAFAWALHVLF